MKHISRYLTLISSVIILASCSGRTETDFPEEVRDALAELDGAMSRKAQIEEELESRIGQMHRQLSSAGTDSARYSALDMLYSSYYQYDIDSAIFYARTKLELARDMGLTSVIHDAVLDLADRYALSGMYPEVLDIMENLEVDQMPVERRPAFRRPFRIQVHRGTRSVFGRIRNHGDRYRGQADPYHHGRSADDSPGRYDKGFRRIYGCVFR